MKCFFTFLISLSFLGCNKSDIKGHWHINHPKQNNIISNYYTVDVINDSMAFLSKNSILYTVKGSINNEFKTLVFPNDCCGCTHFEYDIKGNKISLLNALGIKREGFRCDSSHCDIIQDFTKDLKQDISLPFANNSFKRSVLNTVHPLSYIIIGKSKDEYQTSGDSIQIDLFNYNSNISLTNEQPYNELSEIEHWIEDEQSYTPEAIRKQMNWVIVPDKNLPVAKINIIIDELQKSNLKRIFILVLKKNYLKERGTIFDYIHISEFDLNSKVSIYNYLNN